MKRILFLALILTATSSFGAYCRDTHLSTRKIVQLIDEEYGDGAANHCRFSKVWGISSDYLFGRVDCSFNGRSYVSYIFGEDTGGFFSKPKCDIYLDY